jgi:regulator of protease activity HflC (stomatin/prohibitin superfamily)
VAHIALEYQVDENKAYEAHYRLANPAHRLQARATEIVTRLLYTMSFDDALTSNAAIADAIRDELTSYAAEHGYLITNVVVVSVEPEKSVAMAMSAQAALARENETDRVRADANNSRTVAAAEAEATAARLRGGAEAGALTALAGAVAESAHAMAERLGVTPGAALDAVLDVQSTASTTAFANSGATSHVIIGGSDTTTAVAAGTRAGNSHGNSGK